MSQTLHLHRVLSPLAALLASAGIAGSIVARPLAPEPAAKKDPPTAVLAVERLEVDNILVAPKDKALRDALHMLPARLAEVPGEAKRDGNDPPPEALLELLPRLAGAHIRMGVSYDPTKPTGGFAGAGVVMSFESSDEADAAKTTSLMSSFLDNAPGAPQRKPSKAVAGMTDMQTPLGQVRFGPRKAGDKWAFEVHVGTVPDPDAAIKTLDGVSAPGVASFLRGRFDAAPLTPLIGMVQVFAAANPAAAGVITKMTEAGFIGPDCAKAEVVVGHTADRTVMQMAYRGLGDRAEKAGVSRQNLTDAELAVIPADCYWAGLGTANMKYARAELDAVLASATPAREFLSMFREHTGVDLLDDLFASIGGTYGMYMADALGGPNIGGIVALLSLADSEAFARATGKLAAVANKMLSEEGEGKPKGYVSLRSWTDGSTKGHYTSLRFPGVPVPLELTYAVAGKWLVLGGTPQAAIAAVRQIESGGKGLKEHAAVTAMLASTKGATSVHVIETGKTMRYAYPIVSILGSAVGNLVRSRGENAGGREPGLIVPTYADLVQDARPLVQAVYWDGADLIARCEGDRSVLVNVGGVVGAAAPIMPFIPAVAMAIHMKMNEMHGHDHEDEDDHEANMEEDGDAEKAHKPNFNLVPR